jgi:hypothetical protein
MPNCNERKRFQREEWGLCEMRPGAGGGDGVADRVGVVAVDLLDVPAGGAKALDLSRGRASINAPRVIL